MFPCRGDYIITPLFRGLGASTRLSVLPFGIVVERSPAIGASLLIVLGFTLGVSSNSPSSLDGITPECGLN